VSTASEITIPTGPASLDTNGPCERSVTTDFGSGAPPQPEGAKTSTGGDEAPDIAPMEKQPLVDCFGRQVTYLRLSVTDRCDLRCTYCMPAEVRFLKHADVLSIEEMYRLCAAFMTRGIRKIRITGGEPLVRKGVMALFEALSPHLHNGELDEIVLTTNGTLLDRYAMLLAGFGVRRVNVSLDTLGPERYRAITRFGRIERVLSGIDAAQAAGMRVKLNAVAARGAFQREVDGLIRFAHKRDMDLTFIEEMPLGVTSFDRARTFLSLAELRSDLQQRFELEPLPENTGGPARYFRVRETGGTLGFITPLSCDFCSSCNRVRVSSTGLLYTCLGREAATDLRDTLRSSESDVRLQAIIIGAIIAKPQGHRFVVSDGEVTRIARAMSTLGG
jgi:cyclic pyranopterin phosphate synthase